MTKHKKEENLEQEELKQDVKSEQDENPNVEAQKVEEPKEETLEDKYNKLNDAHLRLMAEFDNYRKRTMREKADLLKSAGESVLVSVLPLVDDFERGLQVTADSSDVSAVREGMELIYDKFIAFLKQHGVSEIEAAEKDFDTEFHEAITTIPAPTEELKGKVIDCTKKGYLLNDKVIRFAQVVVGE